MTPPMLLMQNKMEFSKHIHTASTPYIPHMHKHRKLVGAHFVFFFLHWSSGTMPYRGHSNRLHCPPIHNKNIYKLFICSRSLWQKRGPLMTTYGLISLAFDFPELRKMIHHCQTQPQESEPLAAGNKNNQNNFREKKGGHVLVSREIPFTQKKNFTSLHRYF